MTGPVGEDRSAALVFLLLTFAVTWTAWLVVAFAAPGAAAFVVGGPVFLVGVFAPGLMAVGLTAYREGRPGVARLLARIGVWQVRTHWYVFAVGYVATTKLFAALAHRLSNAWRRHRRAAEFGASRTSRW